MSGKSGIAPCGHPGTYVTSTFITCNERCEFQTAKPVVARRGEPGHVDMCACAPCQIRRRTEYINLIDKDGRLVHTFLWDGVKNELDWVPTRAAEIRHWRMHDAVGDMVASGNLAFDLAPNRKAHLNIKLFMDAADRVTLSIEQEKYWDIEHHHIKWKTAGQDFAESAKKMLSSTGFPADSIIGRVLIENQVTMEKELRQQLERGLLL